MTEPVEEQWPRRVLVHEGVLEKLGSVVWGEPDEDGFYEPVVWSHPKDDDE